MRKTNYLPLVLFCWLISTNVNSQGIELEVVTEVLHPYQYENQYGQPSGFSLEVIKELLNRLGVNPKIEFYPWSRSYQIAQSRKNVLIFSLTRTTQREGLFHWIGKLTNEEYYFFKLKNNNFKALNINDLKSYTIIVNKDSSMNDFLKSYDFLNIERTSSVEQIPKMLFDGRADILFGPDVVVKAGLEGLGYDFSKFTKVFQTPEAEADLYIAMSLGSDPKYVDKVTRVYELMLRDGTVSQIRKKHNL